MLNRKGTEVLGYTQEELVGKNWFDVCVPTRVQEEVKNAFARLMAGENETVGHIENFVVTRSGEGKGDCSGITLS